MYFYKINRLTIDRKGEFNLYINNYNISITIFTFFLIIFFIYYI